MNIDKWTVLYEGYASATSCNATGYSELRISFINKDSLLVVSPYSYYRNETDIFFSLFVSVGIYASLQLSNNNGAIGLINSWYANWNGTTFKIRIEAKK